MAMQTQQTTQIHRPKGNKKAMFYLGASGLGLAVMAYVIATAYYKFYLVDKDTMGTFFYSWRIEGADDAMFKERIGKLPSGGGVTAETKEIFTTYFNDQYGEHMPRGTKFYLTLGFPNQEVFLKLRKAFTEADTNKAVGLKGNYEEDTPEKEIMDYIKTSNSPLYMEPMTTKTVKEAITKAYKSMTTTEQKTFKTVAPLVIDFMNKVISVNAEYKFDGTTPSPQAIEDLTEILRAMDTEKRQTSASVEGEASTTKLNDDIKYMIKHMKKPKGNDLPANLATNFFSEMIYGKNSTPSAFGYSRLAYLVYYLTLDVDQETFSRGESLATRQGEAEKRTTALSTAIAYGFAKLMSEDISAKVVSDNRGVVVYSLFTPTITNAALPEAAYLEDLRASLKEKKAFIATL
ncbi:hypothetical protein NEDG_01227 [Nematocida displodere]|uniref:Uncharacterized protein n=1 Tax=Nematocida displodere TaxID=1805483 RepID=A0A177EB99_9MICR|nr:hypothetical protein NEDG_01227 [Nematocida displodere]